MHTCLGCLYSMLKLNMEIGISRLHAVGISEMIFSNFDNNEILI